MESDSILSVSEVTRAVRDLLEGRFNSVAVTGEISNLNRHSSGHLYFTLKDARSQLSCVMFRGNAQRTFFRPENGMEVVCRGSITVYEPRGSYQLLVAEIHPRGEGALRVAFERLKQRLHEEGLFDESRKKALPRFPRTVALVTSCDGAAVRDMISVIRRRNPAVDMLLVPVQVQGAGAAAQISGAIDMCNVYGEIDVIIAGRGGGSIEDLWAFNEEEVARSIARSEIPVISAVGHEVDFTIADFAADRRAATPSVAAEMAVPTLEGMIGAIAEIFLALRKSVNFKMDRMRDSLAVSSAYRILNRTSVKLTDGMQALDGVSEELGRAVKQKHLAISHELETAGHRLAGHDPARILSRGYAMVRKGDDYLQRASQIRAGDLLSLLFADGCVQSEAKEDG